MKVLRFFLVFMFLLLFAGSSILLFLKKDDEFSDLENRKLSQMPAWETGAVLSGKFQKQYEEYLTDQMFAKDRWMEVYAAIEKCSGKRKINGVYIGSDGYLIEDCNEEEFDSEQEKENIRLLSKFIDDGCRRFGKEHFSCIFVPSKQSVLEEKLPLFSKKYSGSGIVEEIKSKSHFGERVISLEAELKKHSKEYIYYRTDHHWTSLGAFYGASAFKKMNGLGESSLSDYEREVVFDDFLGTTYNKAHIWTEKDEVVLFHGQDDVVKVDGNNGEFVSDSCYFKDAAQKGFDRYQIFFSKNTSEIVIDTGRKTGRSLLVIKDSFANCFVPFLTDAYEKIVKLDCRYGKKKVSGYLNKHEDITDVLVLFNVEKFRLDNHLRKLDIGKKKKGKNTNKNKDEEEDLFGDLESLS